MDREKNRRLIKRVFIEGRGRVIARPLYQSVIAAELAAHRVMDTLLPKAPGDPAFLNENLTAVIKTFERPKVLARLVRSIRRFYPELRIVVVDDSRAPEPLEGVETYTLPYDSGVAAGRNAGVARVETPYLLLLDDDFVFYRATRLAPALARLDAEPAIDIMGGIPVNLPFYGVTDYRRASLFPSSLKPLYPAGATLAGLPVLDKVAQFYIARTESIRKVLWDENLKRIDHADFFTRAKGVLTSVLNPGLRCLHAKTPFDEAYMRIRQDKGDFAYLRKKYYGA